MRFAVAAAINIALLIGALCFLYGEPINLKIFMLVLIIGMVLNFFNAVKRSAVIEKLEEQVKRERWHQARAWVQVDAQEQRVQQLINMIKVMRRRRRTVTPQEATP